MERPPATVLFPLALVVVLTTFAVSLAAEGPASEPDAEVAAPEGVAPPQIVLGTQKAPRFPPAALAARFSGAVTVQLTVNAKGGADDVKAVECNHPNVGFEEAAVEAVKKWRFEPALKEGEPVEFTTTFRLNFYTDRRDPYVTASGIPSLAGEERALSEHRAGSPSTTTTGTGAGTDPKR